VSQAYLLPSLIENAHADRAFHPRYIICIL
jgi:hypothetical protein